MMPRFEFIRTTNLFDEFVLSVYDNEKFDSLHIEIINGALSVWSNNLTSHLTNLPVELSPFIALAYEMYKNVIITE